MQSIPERQDNGSRPRDHTGPAHGQGTSAYAGKRRERRRAAQEQAAARDADYTEALAVNAQPPPPAKRQRQARAGPVTVRRADGTSDTRPAYTKAELAHIVSGAPKPEPQAPPSPHQPPGRWRDRGPIRAKGAPE